MLGPSYEPSDVFAAIAAPARRLLLARLTDGEKPMLELAKPLSMTLPAVSQHLSVLRAAGLVTMRKSGRQRIYRLNPAPLKAVSDWVRNYEGFWSEKLADLGTYLEETE